VAGRRGLALEQLVRVLKTGHFDKEVLLREILFFPGVDSDALGAQAI
jgi:hypothetical protein